MNYYAECEHFEKVEKILNEEGVNWDNLVANDWKFSFELSVKGMLHRLLITPNANSLENKWRDYFGKISDIFSFDKFIFVPSLGIGTVSSPHHIKLEFNTPSGKTSGDSLREYLKNTILPIIETEIQLVDDKNKRARITEFLDIVRDLANYVQLWSHDNMAFQSYFEMRRNNYHDETEQFKSRANEFSNTKQDEEGQQRVREIIEQIERVEIRRIFGTDCLRIT